MDANLLMHRIEALAGALIALELRDDPPKLRRNTRPPRSDMAPVDFWMQRGIVVHCDNCRGNPHVGAVYGSLLRTSEFVISRPNHWLLKGDTPGPVNLDFEEGYKANTLGYLESSIPVLLTDADAIESFVREEATEVVHAWKAGYVTADWAFEEMAALGARGSFRWQCSTCNRGKTAFSVPRMEALLKHVWEVEQRNITLPLAQLARINTGRR